MSDLEYQRSRELFHLDADLHEYGEDEEFKRGLADAENGEPFEESETELWKIGHRNYTGRYTWS